MQRKLNELEEDCQKMENKMRQGEGKHEEDLEQRIVELETKLAEMKVRKGKEREGLGYLMGRKERGQVLPCVYLSLLLLFLLMLCRRRKWGRQKN